MALGFEVIKGQMSQFFQIAHLVEAVAGLLFYLTGTANANIHLAEIWMFQRQILANIAYTTADFAVRITRVGVTLNLR